MKKILIFIDNLSSGGAQRRACNIAILLKRMGYVVSILIYGEYYFFKYMLDKQNIPVVLINSSNKLCRVLKIRKYLKNAEIDLVISFLETPGFIASVSKIGNRKWKLITTESSAKEKTFTSVKSKLYNIFLPLSDAKVCNSFNACSLWEKHYPKYSNRNIVIYNPVIIPNIEIYLNYINMSDKIKIIIVASYQELKNPLRVIEAVNMMKESDRTKIVIDWYGRIEVVKGNSEIYDEAEKRITNYSLQETIRLHPESIEIYNLMSQSDVVGLFSTVEGLPNVICEGMMLGKAIIMSKVSDYHRLVNGNGFLCDADSSESICNAITNIARSDSCKLKIMGMRSREMAREMFMADIIAGQWKNLIEGI